MTVSPQRVAVLAALAACAALAAARIAQAPASAAPPPEFHLAADSVAIPAQVRGNLIYLRGRINGSDSLWIAFDSGAQSNVLDEDRARELGLEVRDRGQANGSGGMAPSGHVADVTIELNGLTIEHAEMTTISLANLGGPAGRRIDAIVGGPILSRFVTRIDYEHAVLTFLDPTGFHPPAGASELPLTFVNGLPYVAAQVKLPGQPMVGGRFVIDSGSGNSLILAAPFVREHHALDAVGKTIEIRGNGVGGQSRNRMGRVDSLAIGGFGLSRPTASLRTSDVGTVAAGGAIGNIGGDVLRHFTVTFDYPHTRMFVAPNGHFGDPFEADMAGLGVQMPPGTHHLEVMWTQPDSPASEAGIQAGDAIESVNGAAPDSIGMPAVRAMFRRPGETYRLLLRRGDQTHEIALTTRRLI